jgi:ATP-dependent helicase/nuclease subunit A
VGFARFVKDHKFHAPDAAALMAICLTQEGGERLKPFNKAFEADLPDLCDRMRAEITRVYALSETLKRVGVFERSSALMLLLNLIIARYEAEKAARARLDFEDLIAALSRLLGDQSRGPWVRYKLDGGISHVLIDEGQDTNPEQWKLIRPLAEEILGSGGIDRPRSLFAVGDGKQSIYSFQGADPKRFRDERESLQDTAKQNHRPFERVRLTTSFRTLSSVLLAVDRVFEDEARRVAVLEDLRVEHRTARRDEGGHVTLWPLVEQPVKAAPLEEWPLEAASGTGSPQRQLAERIAATISQWVANGRPLEHRGRAVGADDVLVLVQTRSVLFHEIIRALRAAGLATPGADRLQVTGHIAVRDLLALSDVLLNPTDDLQLAALLRSPLFDVSEDQLMALAAERVRGERLWNRLETATDPAAEAAYQRLYEWRRRLDFDRPYEFFADVLYRDGGLERFHRRLGIDVDDVLSEFLALALDHESRPVPALQAFLAEMRHRKVIIKRELSERGAGVRVMTVHGAKGLEAPIVILADATALPSGPQLNRPLYLDEHDRFMVHASSTATHAPETLALREAVRAQQFEEYWRKLYVAMTRAEDELYVTGIAPQKSSDTQSWYQAIEASLGPACVATTADDGAVHRVYRSPDSVPVAPVRVRPAVLGQNQPAFLAPSPIPAPPRRDILRPSSLGDDDPLHVLDTAAQTQRDTTPGRAAERARGEGTALHALLQHLPRIAPPERHAIGLKAMAVLLPDQAARHEALVDKALSILDQPDLQPLFGPHSRAEVPFLVDLVRDGTPIRAAGRIDRLVVTESGRVRIIDFKSDSVPATSLETVNPAYLQQLGLYALCATQLFPGKEIEAAILWTALESLLELPAALLADSVRGFTLR